MNYLLYQLHGSNPCDNAKCLVFDPNSYKMEHDFDSFINYTGPLKRVVFLEEYSIGRATDIWHDKRFLNNPDIIWIGNFVGGGNGAGEYSVYEKFKKIIDVNSVNYEMVHILTNSEYEFSLLDDVFKDNKPNYSAVHYCDMIAIEEMLHSQKPKRFTFFSRNFNGHRFLIFLDLKRRGVISNSYFSFFNIRNIYKTQEESYSYYDLTELSRIFYELINDLSSTQVLHNK